MPEDLTPHVPFSLTISATVEVSGLSQITKEHLAKAIAEILADTF